MKSDWQTLFHTLHIYHVEYILTGSMAVYLYGVEMHEPNDIDIVPNCTPVNFERLRHVLQDLQASTSIPEGHWQRNDYHEWQWESIEVSETERGAWHWQPNIHNWRSFDHAFQTAYGQLDCVPHIAGEYPDLHQRSTQITAYEQTIQVASIEDILTTLTIPRRKKDHERVAGLRVIQRQRLNRG